MTFTPQDLTLLSRIEQRDKIVNKFVEQRSDEYKKRVEQTPDSRKSSELKRKAMKRKIDTINMKLP